MANTKSAAKAARQSAQRRDRNKSVLSAVRTQIRKAREAMESGDSAAIDAELRKAAAMLDKAASKGVLHKSNASRRVGRLSVAANAAKAKA